MQTWSTWSPRLLSVLRIVAGLLYAQHGMQKLFNFPPGEHGGVPLMSFMGFAGTLELVGGLLLILGLFTRVTAFILSGMMAIAYWTVHAKGGLYPINNGGDLAVLFCFVFLYISAAGPGPISLDAARAKN